MRFRPEFPILEKTSYLDEELDRAFAAIDEIRSSRAWERWTERRTVVT